MKRLTVKNCVGKKVLSLDTFRVYIIEEVFYDGGRYNMYVCDVENNRKYTHFGPVIKDIRDFYTDVTGLSDVEITRIKTIKKLKRE